MLPATVSGSAAAPKGAAMPTFRAGWRDRLDGQGFPRVYDMWTYRQQVAYEEGRRVAALVQGYMTLASSYPNLATRRPQPKKFPALLRVDARDERTVTRKRMS